MSRSPFLVNVADLSRPRAAPRRIELEAPVTWSVDLSRVLADPPLKASLQLARTSGGLVVTGSADARAEHTCYRCLRRTQADMHVEIAQLFVAASVADDDGDYVLEGDELDLQPMLRDEVLLAMPLLPVCGDDCAGLPDGVALASDDDASTEGSPFEALKDLFE